MSHLAAKVQFLLVRMVRVSDLQLTCGSWLRCARLRPSPGVEEAGWSAAAPPGASAGCRPRPAHSDTHGNTGERQAHFYLATHSYPFVPMPRASITEAQRDTRPCPPAAAQPGGECCWMPAGRLRGKQFLLTGCVIYLREVCQALKGQSCSLSPCSRLTDEEPASGGSVTRICTGECADGEHLRTSSAFLGP